MALQEKPMLFDGPTLVTLQTIQRRLPRSRTGHFPGLGLVVRQVLATHPDFASLLATNQSNGHALRVERMRAEMVGAGDV